MLDESIISAQGLTRYFGSKAVVHDLELDIPRGSVTGLLGLNGAGKTTTLRMLLGFLDPTRGQCQIFGRDSQSLTPEDRARIGYTVEGHFLYGWMTVRQSQEFQQQTFPEFNCRLFAETMRRFGIDPSQRNRTLSRGQRAGVSLALTLATEPELLILDDPALGLDPVSRRALNETLLDFCDGGQRTILLSSHMLDDVERVADRVAVMVHGRLLVHTTIDDFRARVAAWSLDILPTTRSTESIPRLIQTRELGGRTVVTVVDPDQETTSALLRLSNSEPVRLPVTFEDAVIAYLSRSRDSQSYLVHTGA
jgi:ABC-2 type transport system ATP-binding protein